MLFSTTVVVSAFSSCSRHNNHQARLPLLTTNHPSTPHPMTLHATIDDDDSNNSNELQALGNSLILSAARYHGATDKMISIDWKADRIIVTVDVGADEEYEGGSVVGELEEYDEEDFEDDYDDEEDYEDEDFNDDEEEDFEALQEQLGLQPSEPDSPQSTKIDLTLIARTINEYLSADGENTPQFKIAQLHEIEVTTPEFDNVLRVDSNGVNMFEVYKGFDVIVDYWEVPKKKKSKKKSGKATKEVGATTDDTVNQQQQEEEEPKKTQKIIEGKLVGRDEEKDVTLINVKGRIIKIKNDMIESVTLPKAKREKGAK
eukprot:scaffold10859_cov95-Skeletonema_dohrnii-CCMP3373.AAC.3